MKLTVAHLVKNFPIHRTQRIFTVFKRTCCWTPLLARWIQVSHPICLILWAFKALYCLPFQTQTSCISAKVSDTPCNMCGLFRKVHICFLLPLQKRYLWGLRALNHSFSTRGLRAQHFYAVENLGFPNFSFTLISSARTIAVFVINFCFNPMNVFSLSASSALNAVPKEVRDLTYE